ERLSSNRAADARERDRRADRLANHELLDMRLGELVAIMASDPPRMAVGKRKHGQLDQGRAPDQPVEYPELERMDHVFGIVESDRRGRVPRLDFIGDQCIIKVVEA